MITEEIKMWDKIPGDGTPKLTAYIPEEKKSDGAVVIFPGGAYAMLAEHEGKGYAEFFVKHGITAFVCEYRVCPHEFPLPLADARRSVRLVRYYADKFGINKNKVYVMGSSAGGHLAAMLCTYREKIDFEGIDEIDNESCLPDGQILCYPVIKLLGKGYSHLGSGQNLLGRRHAEMGEELSPDLIADENTPKAFVWHTCTDDAVNVANSLDYCKRLRDVGVKFELHVYPKGDHGWGLAEFDDYISRWSEELIRWLQFNNF